MEKVLITGAKSQIGSELREIANNFSNFEFFYAGSELDITKQQKIEDFVYNNHINVIINTAAYTNVEKAEIEIKKAELVNTLALKNLVEISEKHNCKLIHYSTDYVYNSLTKKILDEKTITEPVNYYGKSKRNGELFIENSSCESIIIRTSWLYSSYGTNFVNTIIQKAKNEKKINVVSDQFGCPTYAKDLALDTMNILNSKLKLDQKGKIYNYSNLGYTNWSNFAKKIIKILNINCKVNEVSTDFFNSKVYRPIFSITNKNKIITTFNLDIPSWEDSLENYLNKL